MEQQQIKVSFSLGTKLLISVVLLLFTVIVFLSISSIFLFREDKRAYTYESQSTAALLAGKDFVTRVNRTLEVLKTLIAVIDPNKPVSSLQTATLKSLLDNQGEVLTAYLDAVDLKTSEHRVLTQVSKEKSLKELNLSAPDYDISKEWLKNLLPDLVHNSFALVNLAKPGVSPTLTVLFADINLKDNPNGMPVAVGTISLKAFSDDLSHMKLNIATTRGWVLYDTDPTVYYGRENMSENPLFSAASASRVQSGALEYNINGTHFLGSYLKPGLGTVVTTKVEWQRAMMATYTLIEKFLLLGLMAVGVAVVFAIFFSKTLTAPLGRLYDATKEVGEGNFLLRLEEKGRDEISALSASFNIMSRKIGDLINESIKKVQLENQLNITSTVQQSLIPPNDFRGDWLHIHSFYKPADACGGDWWGFFGVGNRVAVMIADSTGHGLPNALITASARSCFSVMHKLAQEDTEFSFSPGAMLSFANRVIFDASLGNILMTFFIGVIDVEAKTLTYASAGHNPPWFFKKKAEGYERTSLVVPGSRLGENRDSAVFEEKSITIDSNDILFLYTDGLTEGTNLAGEQYGKKKVREVVELNLGLGPEGIVSNLMADFQTHNTGKPLDDDVTVAAAMILDLARAHAKN